MKKTKLLFATSLVALSLPQAILITSCGDRGDDTKHVTTEVKKAPQVGKDFEFTFKLDDSYSLNVADSNIQFGSTSNSLDTVALSKCTIDSSAKTITVPGEYVTSSEYKLNILSEKQIKIEDQSELKKVVVDFLKSETDKDITYEGEIDGKLWTGDIEQDPSTWTIKGYQKGSYTYLLKNKDIKTVIKNTTYDAEGKIEQPETTGIKYDIADPNGIGFWSLTKSYNDYWTAYPTPYGGLQNQISSLFTFDSYFSTLKYDSSKNAYDGTVYQNGKNKISLNFYLSKDKKSVKAFEIIEFGTGSQSIIGDMRAYCSAKNQGKTTFDKPDESKWHKNNVFDSSMIQYDQSSGKYVYSSTQAQFSSPLRIEIKLEKFDNTKKTYLKIDSNRSSSIIYNHSDDVLYLGSQKLTKGVDWTIGQDPNDGLYYVEINATDPTKTLYCVANSTTVPNTNKNTASDDFDLITIYQKDN